MPFGPIVFRLFNGIQPMDADGAADLARMTFAPTTKTYAGQSYQVC